MVSATVCRCQKECAVCICLEVWQSVNGFSDCVQMSKSRGNVVDPVDRLGRFTADGLRYFLLREGSLGSDGSKQSWKTQPFCMCAKLGKYCVRVYVTYFDLWNLSQNKCMLTIVTVSLPWLEIHCYTVGTSVESNNCKQTRNHTKWTSYLVG